MGSWLAKVFWNSLKELAAIFFQQVTAYEVYEYVTQKLLFEGFSYDDAIEHGIALVEKSDVFIYNK